MDSSAESGKFSSNITTWTIYQDSTMTSIIKLLQFKLPPGIHFKIKFSFKLAYDIQEISGQIEGKEAKMLPSGNKLITGKEVNTEMEVV